MPGRGERERPGLVPQLRALSGEGEGEGEGAARSDPGGEAVYEAPPAGGQGSV